MINKQIAYLVVSDIHLGHQRNPTANIVANLISYFKDLKDTHLDYIFIAGDVYHKLLDLSQTATYESYEFIRFIVNYCATRNIKLRILEGTPSHDWKQSKIFQEFSKLNPNSDLIYYPNLAIEVDKETNISILYIPDKYKDSAIKIQKEVEELLKIHNLTKVDIIVMHGQFPHQIPQAIHSADTHNPDYYLSIANYYIHIGHVHIHSVFNNILAQGSFDRLAHGEESDKGAILSYIYPDLSKEHYFIPNKKAMIFKTIEIKTNNTEKAINQIRKQTKDYPINSYIRIRISKDHTFYNGFDDLKKLFPFLRLERQATEDIQEESYSLVEEVNPQETDFVPISITRDNIKSLLLEEIQSTNNLSVIELEIFNKELSIAID